MTERLVIQRIGHRGDGVADTPEGPVFVSYALPGESVEVEGVPGHADRRRLLRVENESPERVAPICPHFGICGGCAIQHWSVERYRGWKRGLVVEALAQAGIHTPVADLIDAQGEGRRRAVFHARRGAHDMLQVGFAAPRAHEIVAIDRCPILAPGLDGALKAARAIAEVLKNERKPLDLQFTATAAGMDVDVRGSGALNARKTAELAHLAEAHGLARLTRHGDIVTQRTTPTLKIGRANVALPPGSFLQATAEGEAVLARLVDDATPKAKMVADLFCGFGPFALRLAERARVSAADTDPAAIAALTLAAESTTGLKPVEAQARDLFRRPFTAKELSKFDAVVFDPPRQGAQAQARELATSKVSAVVAVSCNPATFARDARILIDGGYKLASVTPVDQFCYSAHVELAGKFTK
jgi:23S rRNA (uracil1939-C5)-methyltransferase